jgi:hypothetical protein
MNDIPYGFCHCGCGGIAPIAKQNDKSTNRVKGKPMRFIHGHRAYIPKGENHPSWKGGRFLDSRGYVLIHNPSHHRALKGYVFEHIIVLERVLGRKILSTEAPHHRDGNRANNDPGNLLLFATHRMHGRFHQSIRALLACGHADWRVCGYCHKYDEPSKLFICKSVARHPDCHKEYRRNLRANKI